MNPIPERRLKKDKHPPHKTFPYDFPVEMETRAHGQVVARCPLLPGCQAQGKNAEHGISNCVHAWYVEREVTCSIVRYHWMRRKLWGKHTDSGFSELMLGNAAPEVNA